jgi:hypothetical protein
MIFPLFRVLGETCKKPSVNAGLSASFFMETMAAGYDAEVGCISP